MFAAMPAGIRPATRVSTMDSASIPMMTCGVNSTMLVTSNKLASTILRITPTITANTKAITPASAPIKEVSALKMPDIVA